MERPFLADSQLGPLQTHPEGEGPAAVKHTPRNTAGNRQGRLGLPRAAAHSIGCSTLDWHSIERNHSCTVTLLQLHWLGQRGPPRSKPLLRLLVLVEANHPKQGAADPTLDTNGSHLDSTDCTDYSSPNTATAAIAAGHTNPRVADRNSIRQTSHIKLATVPGLRSPDPYLVFTPQALHIRGTAPTL